jgi:cyclopropane fatty-acyl-phospholipid synthase-like methyltransferase
MSRTDLEVKDMKLYAQAQSILTDLSAQGFPPGSAISPADAYPFDQLHYHGVESVAHGIEACGIMPGQSVLEVGAGWGGPSRCIATETGALVTALELQADFNAVGEEVSARCGLSELVRHLEGDFLTEDLPQKQFDHVVSWLALYHIPGRATLSQKMHDVLRPGGMLFFEDLMQGSAFDALADPDALSRELFANSLVSKDQSVHALEQAGFEVVEARTMTEDWRAFTTSRLALFDQRREAFIALHGEALFTARRHFYAKIVEYFTSDAIGGLQVTARRPD